MNSIAFFDFDKTIISHDTGYYFILFSLKKHFLRLVFALVLSPLAFTFFLSNKTRFIGNSIYLWLSTVGLSPKQLSELRANFIDYYLGLPQVTIYKVALIEINDHARQGHQVVIVSGASQWMLDAIVERTELPELKIVGSNELRLFDGMVSSFHCFGQNKIKQLEKTVNLKSYHRVFGYSDSSSDIPLLSICHTKYMVNPSKRCLANFRKAFDDDVQILYWI